MKIGQVAREAGVSIDTVRFYERRGVLPAPERKPSGYRMFTEAAVVRIRMTRALQDMGFTLDEVIDALRAHDAGGATCDSERWRLEAVVDRIDARIAELRRARRNTMKILEECRAGRCRFAPPQARTHEAEALPIPRAQERRVQGRDNTDTARLPAVVAPRRRRTTGP